MKNNVDLVEFIDWGGVEGLNAKSADAVLKILGKKEDGEAEMEVKLESNADEQLLINIPFKQVVKLSDMAIAGPDDHGARNIRLFINKEHMDFSNANEDPPSGTVILSPDDLKTRRRVHLKYVNFQSVRSLAIFVVDNQSDSETTELHRIVLYGTTVETTDMKGLKKIEDS